MIEVIILAAGKGTRMKTDKPKALVEAKGRPLLAYVLDAVRGIVDKPHLVVGYKGQSILDVFGEGITAVWQDEPKGTGHAVMAAESILKGSSARNIVVLFSDQPLVTCPSIRMLVQAREKAGAAFSLATVAPEHHNGEWAVFQRNGRIVRDQNGSIESIVEYKDASEEIRTLTEVNISAYCFDTAWLWKNLGAIRNKNAAGEYYLTDLVAIARAQGDKVVPVVLPTREGMGANSPEELLVVERYL